MESAVKVAKHGLGQGCVVFHRHELTVFAIFLDFRQAARAVRGHDLGAAVQGLDEYSGQPFMPGRQGQQRCLAHPG